MEMNANSNGGISDYLFGPLGAEYCNYFYYLTVLSFLTFLFVLGSCLYIAVTKKSVDYIQLMLVSFQPFLAYFVNRLFYSMCMNSNDV